MIRRIKKISVLTSLLIIFFGPVVLANWLYAHGHQYFHKTSNRGSWVTSQINLNQLHLVDDKGHAFVPESGKKHWKILYVVKDNCDAICLETLNKMHQVRLALGTKQLEVENLVVVAKRNAATKAMQKFIQTEPSFKAWSFPKSKLEAAHLNQDLYITDPEGRIILSYSVTTPPRDLYHDLKRLVS